LIDNVLLEGAGAPCAVRTHRSHGRRREGAI
jgi:hypothetical protein